MELVLLPLLLLAGLLTTLDGGSDDDTSPDDRLEGTDGADQLAAGRSAQVFGMEGDDEIVATDNAVAYGGAGDDMLSVGENGSPSAVALYGGEGNDALFNALGDSENGSTLSGDAGDDYLYSIRAGDLLSGGTGADHLTAVNGVTMTGGEGNDIFELFESSTNGADGPMVITDYIAGQDQIAVSMGHGDWLETMEITAEEIDGSTLVRFAFDPAAPAFPMGLDNDALDIRAPDDFSILLEGVTDFDPTTIQLLTVSNSDKVIDPLETFTVERGTTGDDLIENDNFAPTVIFAGDGDDTISSAFRATISAGDGDDIIIHRLIAEPLDEVTDDTATMADSWSFGGAGSDLIVLEDDFIAPSNYDSGVHNIGGFEVGTDQLGLLLPSASAGDASVSFGVDAASGFVTVQVADGSETLRIVLHGITQAPPPGFVQLFENEAAVIARTPYATL